MAKKKDGAATAAQPEKIEEVDALRYENAALKSQLLDLQKQLIDVQQQALRGQADILVRGLNEKYKLGEQDRVDLGSRTITRAEKAPAAPQASAVVPQA